jgi:hypothetical protein
MVTGVLMVLGPLVATRVFKLDQDFATVHLLLMEEHLAPVKIMKISLAAIRKT